MRVVSAVGRAGPGGAASGWAGRRTGRLGGDPMSSGAAPAVG